MRVRPKPKFLHLHHLAAALAEARGDGTHVGVGHVDDHQLERLALHAVDVFDDDFRHAERDS